MLLVDSKVRISALIFVEGKSPVYFLFYIWNGRFDYFSELLKYRTYFFAGISNVRINVFCLWCFIIIMFIKLNLKAQKPARQIAIKIPFAVFVENHFIFLSGGWIFAIAKIARLTHYDQSAPLAITGKSFVGLVDRDHLVNSKSDDRDSNNQSNQPNFFVRM